MTEAIVRPITAPDAEGVATLYRTYGFDPGAFAPVLDGPGLLRVLEERGTALFLVAEHEGRVVGTVGFFQMAGQRVAYESELFADLFFLDPRLRGGHLAGRLFSEAMVHLIDQDVESLLLAVNPSNQLALPLYHKVGFRSLGDMRTDEAGETELVSHLPKLLKELRRQFPASLAEKIGAGAGWRGMSAKGAEDVDGHGIELVDGRETVRYELRYPDIHVRALMDPDRGDILDLAVTEPGQLPEPRISEPPSGTARTGAPETVRAARLTLQLDPLNGVLSLYHADHLGPLIVDPWPAAGPPFLSGWRRQPDRKLSVSTRGNGWIVGERHNSGTLYRSSELTPAGVEHTVWWDGDAPPRVLAAPWCAARQTLLWTEGGGHRPVAVGRYPVHLVNYEGLAQDRPDPKGPVPGRVVWWDAASRLSLIPHHRGSAVPRFTMGYLPALEWDGTSTLEYGYRVESGDDPFPGGADSAAEVDGTRATTVRGRPLPAPEPVPSGAVRRERRTLARGPVSVIGHGCDEYILSGPAGGVAAWRNAGSDVLATPFPRTRPFGANPRWRAGLWVCRQPGREDPEFGLSWGGDAQGDWRSGEDGVLTGHGLDLRLRPTRPPNEESDDDRGLLCVEVLEHTPSGGLADDLVIHLTPNAPRRAEVLVPGLPDQVWRLDTIDTVKRSKRYGASAAWRRWARCAAVALGSGRWLLALPQRTTSGEVLIRSTSDGIQLSLVSRRPLPGDPTSWLLGVVTDEARVLAWLAGAAVPAAYTPV